MLIILDRDGVINEDSKEYIKSPEEWIPIPGSLEAIAKLNKAGHKVVIASNQSGLARGFYDEATLTKIHEKMQTELAKVGGHIDRIFYCPHRPEDHCTCRKPKPGLFFQIAAFFPTDFTDAIMVGDAMRDIEAARAVSCKTLLVKTGKGAVTLQQNPDLKNVPVFEDLAAAVDYILSLSPEKSNETLES